jgi:hypothetical protein
MCTSKVAAKRLSLLAKAFARLYSVKLAYLKIAESPDVHLLQSI